MCLMFQVTADEWAALRSQIATSETQNQGGRGQHRKYLPLAFTEHGALMAATLRNSPRAVEVSIFVVRAFVHLRELAGSHQAIAKRLDELEDMGRTATATRTARLSYRHVTCAPMQRDDADP